MQALAIADPSARPDHADERKLCRRPGAKEEGLRRSARCLAGGQEQGPTSPRWLGAPYSITGGDLKATHAFGRGRVMNDANGGYPRCKHDRAGRLRRRFGRALCRDPGRGSDVQQIEVAAPGKSWAPGGMGRAPPLLDGAQAGCIGDFHLDRLNRSGLDEQAVLGRRRRWGVAALGWPGPHDAAGDN